MLQFMGSLRAGDDLVTEQQLYASTIYSSSQISHLRKLTPRMRNNEVTYAEGKGSFQMYII